jgi:hypothetical protein
MIASNQRGVRIASGAVWLAVTSSQAEGEAIQSSAAKLIGHSSNRARLAER